MPTLEDQIQLELDMLKFGIERYCNTRQKMIERGKESNTRYGRTIVATHIDQVAELVKAIQYNPSNNRDIAKQKLKSMDPFEVSYITLICMIDSLGKRKPLLAMAKDIGHHLEIQDRLDRWLQDDPEVARSLIKIAQNEKTTWEHAKKGLQHKMNKDGWETNWSQREMVHVGVRMIDCVILGTGLFKTTKLQTSQKKTTTYIEPTETTLEWIRAFNEQAETALPRWAPCIIKPKPWTDVWGGGYYCDEIDPLPIVRAH